jgi:predicted transcriptional regulator
VPTRTTLTLDDDVASRLRRTASRTGRSFRAVVNDALRSGLEVQDRRTTEPFLVAAKDMGLREGLDLASISELLDRVEGPGHR